MSTRDSERILVIVLVALTLLVVFWPRPAPRPSAVIPSAPSLAGGGQVDQRTTGAPPTPVPGVAERSAMATETATVVASGSRPGEASGAPHPTAVTVPVATWTNPDLTPPPLPTSPHTNSDGIVGWATYYGSGTGWTGAINHRLGHVGQVAIVCGGEPFHCRSIAIVDVCACGDRSGSPTLIDLSPFAFRDFAPLSRGVVRISMEILP